MTLAELQQFFAAAATSSSGPIAGLDQVFKERGSLSPSARLAIYNRAYFYRLLDGLTAVFAQTKRVLGDAELERMGLEYLVQHPSQHPAVERVGRHFAAYLRSHATSVEGPIVADLAELEWARLCALVAPNPEAVARAHSIDPAEFPGSRLYFVPALQRLELDRRALDAFESGTVQSSSERRTCAIAVWRSGHAVHHTALEAPEAEALQAAMNGAPMAEVCALFDTGAPVADNQRAFQVMSTWFTREWIAAGGPLYNRNRE